MKTLRRICAASILSLTLAVSALAGHIDTPGAPAPASTPETITNSENATISSDNTGGAYDVNINITGPIVQTILSLIYR